MSAKNTELVEVKSLTQLQNVLMPLQASGTPNEMIAHALTAQLRVLEMIKGIELTASAFDLFMESVYLAVTKTPDEAARGDIQKKASAMIQSLFFFIEVKKISCWVNWKASWTKLQRNG